MMYSKESILACLSDLHKDARGFRPREDYSNLSKKELNEFYNQLITESDSAIEEEKVQVLKSLVVWEARIKGYMEQFDIDYKCAVRWDMQAENSDEEDYYSKDIGYYLYNQGISGIEANKIEKELTV